MDDYESHDDRRLLPGTGFTIEPGLYFSTFGVRSEINVFYGEHDALIVETRRLEVESYVVRGQRAAIVARNNSEPGLVSGMNMIGWVSSRTFRLGKSWSAMCSRSCANATPKISSSDFS